MSKLSSKNAGHGVDLIFAAIEAHRKATSERYIILEALGCMKRCAPERDVTDEAHGRAADIEVAAVKKLLKTVPQTMAGVKALIAYYVEHKDRHFDWIGGETKSKPGRVAFPDDISFENSLIRSLSAAMARISDLSIAA
jgi:hypothetical protein